MADDTMDIDETPELDGDEFVIAIADQTLIDSSPGHYPLRNGRAIVKPAARHEFQKPRLQKKANLPESGVQKKRRSRRHTTAVSERKRQRKIRDAMSDGSYLIKADSHSDDPSAMVQDDEHLQRLTEEIVLQAVTEHTPGLTFPVSHNSQGPSNPFNPFSNWDELQNLTQALEDYQTALARQGKAVLTAEAGILVKMLVQDVLRVYKQIRYGLGNTLDRNVETTWNTLAQSHQDKWSLKWMRGIVWKRLKEKYGKGYRKDFREACTEALETAGRHPELDEVGTLVLIHAPLPHLGKHIPVPKPLLHPQVHSPTLILYHLTSGRVLTITDERGNGNRKSHTPSSSEDLITVMQ